MKFETVDYSPPKGITTNASGADSVELTFRVSTVAGYRTALIVGVLFAAPLLLIGMFTAGGYDFVLGLLITGAGIALPFGLLSLLKKNIRITASPEAVSINGKHYDRRMWGGFRQGDSVTFTHNSNNGSSEDRFGGINFVYGDRTQETRWMVKDVRAVAYVNFLNEVIDSIGAPAADKASPTEGVRKQEF